MLTPGQRRDGRRARRRRLVPRGAADARRVPDQAAAAVRARQRGRRAWCARPRGQRARRPATAWPPSACSAASPRWPWRPRILTFQLPRRARLRPGRRLVLNYHTAYFALEAARPAARGRDACSCTAPPAAWAPPRSRWPRASARARSRWCRATRRRRSRARPAPTRWCAPTAPGRTRPRSCPAAASTSCSTRWAATASPTACARCARAAARVVVGFTGGSIPEVKVNRLLLNNLEVVGAGWGAFVMSKPDAQRGDRRARSTS